METKEKSRDPNRTQEQEGNRLKYKQEREGEMKSRTQSWSARGTEIPKPSKKHAKRYLKACQIKDTGRERNKQMLGNEKG